MRLTTFIFAAFVLPAVLTSSSALAYEMPYDLYPWCAVYGGNGGGGTNCGFLTIEQRRATISGIDGFREPNQFYNPQRPGPATRNRKRQPN